MSVPAASSIDDAAVVVLTVLGAVVFLSCIVFVVARMARRLLGIRVGPIRCLVAGAVGLLCMVVFKDAVTDAENLGALSTVQLALALFVAMGTLALAEFVVPRSGLLWPLYALRALRGRLGRARRYYQISRIFMRHGLGRQMRGGGMGGMGGMGGVGGVGIGGVVGVERAFTPDKAGTRAARALRLALEECGGTFVKLGQLLSTRRDLLPEHLIAELSRLQYAASPEPWARVEAVLTEELGHSAETVFAWIDHEPLASASIAQVHRARLRDGTEVAVKIQRPGIRESVEQDLDIVLAVTHNLQRRARSGYAQNLRDLGQGFATSVREELDFRIEARNSEIIAAALGGDSGVRIPAVHHQLTSGRVLVQEWLDGVTLDRAGALADQRGLDRQALAGIVFESMLQQIMRVGTFHADPHPGNLLLLSDGRIGMLDFGSVGRIDGGVRACLAEMLVAVDRRDPAGMHDALLTLLGMPDAEPYEGAKEPALLERELGRLMARYLDSGAYPDTEMVTALYRTLASFGLLVPPEVAAIFRALSTVEGVLTHLAPGFNMLAAAQTFAAGALRERLGVPRTAQPADGPDQPPSPLDAASRQHVLASEALSLLPMIRRLPRRAERIGASLEAGRLSVRVRFLADERERQFVSGLVHQALVAFLGGSIGLMGVLLVVLGHGQGPQITGSLELFPLVGYHLMAASAILTLRVLYAAIRRPPD